MTRKRRPLDRLGQAMALLVILTMTWLRLRSRAIVCEWEHLASQAPCSRMVALRLTLASSRVHLFQTGSHWVPQAESERYQQSSTLHPVVTKMKSHWRGNQSDNSLAMAMELLLQVYQSTGLRLPTSHTHHGRLDGSFYTFFLLQRILPSLVR